MSYKTQRNLRIFAVYVATRKGLINADIGRRLGKQGQRSDCSFNIIRWKMKIGIFKSNVKYVLLYIADSQNTTQAQMKRIHIFINSSLRQIISIQCLEKINNIELLRTTEQQSAEKEVLKR
jgi:hypothetical protein